MGHFFDGYGYTGYWFMLVHTFVKVIFVWTGEFWANFELFYLTLYKKHRAAYQKYVYIFYNVSNLEVSHFLNKHATRLFVSRAVIVKFKFDQSSPSCVALTREKWDPWTNIFITAGVNYWVFWKTSNILGLIEFKLMKFAILFKNWSCCCVNQHLYHEVAMIWHVGMAPGAYFV